MMRSRRTALTTLLVVLVLAPGSGTAQTYPDRPVKIVVPIGPAGSYDLLGRLVADQLTRRLGQTFTVENRPGAGTVVGTKAVVASAPDGYTLLVGGLSNIVFNAGLYKNLSYDPLADLAPVALVLNISYTLVGSKSLSYATPKEIIAAAKENPLPTMTEFGYPRFRDRFLDWNLSRLRGRHAPSLRVCSRRLRQPATDEARTRECRRRAYGDQSGQAREFHQSGLR